MLEVVSFEAKHDDDWLVYRFPNDDFSSRSKLIVGPGQKAICVHLGQIEGEFKPGVTILSTENYPFLKKFVNDFNGGSAYPFQIYFVNTTVNASTEWSTGQAVRVDDPETKLVVHLRAYGSYIYRLRDPQFLLQMVLGNMESGDIVTFDYFRRKFDDRVQQSVVKGLGQLARVDKIPALEIATQTDVLSERVSKDIDDFFRKYGFEVTDFNTASINIPDEDFNALKEAREWAVLGTSHIAERQLDIGESWSKNEGTAGGAAVGMMGLGLGFNAFGGMMGNPQGYQNNTQGGYQNNPQGFQQNAQAGAVGASVANNGGAQAGFKFCPNCGTKVDAKANFCTNCGERLNK